MSNASSKTATRKRAYAAIAVAAIAAHVTALSGGFVWLDHAHVEAGYAIAPPGRWPELFARGFAETGFYRPLMALSLSIDALVGGPFWFHLTTLAWHAAASVATAAAAVAIGTRRRAAIFAGLLFAVHPLTNLVASAIAFRSEAMVATFLFLFVWAHARRRVVIAAAATLAGCLTKEIAFALVPAFALALELSRVRPRGETKRPVALFAAEGGALAFALLLRVAFAPAFRAHHVPLGFGDAIGTRLAALAKTAALVVVPIDRTICDAFAVTHLWQPRALAGALTLAVLVYLAWRRRGAALLLVLALLPSLQIAPVMRWWSPHYAYVPAAFAMMLVADALLRLERRGVLALRAAVVVLGVVSVVDARRFASDVALWTPEVEARPTCREGQFYLGEVAREGKRWDEAARRYEAALATRPNVIAYVDRGSALVNLGTVRLEQRRFDDARAAFRQALEGTANERARREIVHDLAALALQSGDPAEADQLLAPETARPDAMPASLVVRAIALEKLGRREEAAELRARAR